MFPMKGPGVPLKQNPFDNGSELHKAYSICTGLEPFETWEKFHGSTRDDANEITNKLSPQSTARILGHALSFPPSPDGQANLASEILSCNIGTKDQMSEMMAGLAYLYVDGLLCVLFDPEGPTPDPTVEQTELRTLLLNRYGSRCVFTQADDYDTVAEKGLWGTVTLVELLDVTHIIKQSPSSTYRLPGDAAKFQWANTLGAIIERFGGFKCQEIFGEIGLHSPSNAFLSYRLAYLAFGQLDMWLTPVEGQQDTYKVHHCQGTKVLMVMGIPEEITFRSAEAGEATIQAPDPRVIALHASCAQVAHLSGVADVADTKRELTPDEDAIPVKTHPNAESQFDTSSPASLADRLRGSLIVSNMAAS